MNNKYFFQIIISALFLVLYSCTPTKKIVTKDDAQIVKADEKQKKDEVDVKVWKDTLTDKIPPKDEVIKKGKDSSDKSDERNKQIYNIALVIPFSSTESDVRFLQYYAGAKVAAETLEAEGINLEVNVVDANDKTALANLDVKNTHLIFAPNDEAQLKSLIEVGKANQVPVVSPFFSLSSVENNPYYIQLKPSLKSHFSAMVKHMVENFSNKDVVLVVRDTKTDRSWLKYFQAAAKSAYNLPEEKPFTEYFIKEDSVNQGSNVFGPMLNKGKRVFVFPNYSYKDEMYLYGAMRRLHAEKASRTVNVYGMPILKDSEKMTFDYFQQLHVRIPTSKYVDSESEAVKAFDVKFYDKFGALPDMDAYEGCDNLLFIGRNISKYGRNFQYNLNEDRGYYLQTSFDIQPFKGEESVNDLDYFENKHLDILEFNGLKFVLAE
jgi:Receptor family ligand binding region